MGKLTPLLETGQSRPAVNKMLVLPDSADKLWKGISGEGVFNILTKNLIKTNYIANGDFRINQRLGVGAVAVISATSGRIYCADRWTISSSVNSINFLAIDMGGIGSVEVGPANPSRFAAVFRKVTGVGKLIVSQVIEGTNTSPLRGRVVRFRFAARNGAIAGPIMPIRFGLISLASPGTIDTIPATYVSAISSNYADPIWGANLLSLEPILVENGISQLGGGPSTTTPTKPQFGVSALVDRRWQTYSACFTVPTNCLNLIPVIWTLGDMSVASTTTDELWLSAAGLYLGYETMEWTPLPTEDELKICQRYYCKTFAQGTVPAQSVGINTGEFKLIAGLAGALAVRSQSFFYPVRMRATPSTPITYNPAAASPQARDETSGSDCTGTAPVGASDRSVAITAVGNAATAVGNLIGVHMAVDAEL